MLPYYPRESKAEYAHIRQTIRYAGKPKNRSLEWTFVLELLARFELATVLPRNAFRGSPYDLAIEIDEVASSIQKLKKLQLITELKFFWSC